MKLKRNKQNEKDAKHVKRGSSAASPLLCLFIYSFISLFLKVPLSKENVSINNNLTMNERPCQLSVILHDVTCHCTAATTH